MIKKTREDYLRAVYHIQEEQQDNETGISSVDLSEYLTISKPSVSEMLRKLTKEGLIKQVSYGKIRLSKKGLSEAIEVTKRHRVIESFLSEILKINPKSTHEEAHRLEHAFSNESINAISRLVKDTKNCPHGKPIPQK